MRILLANKTAYPIIGGVENSLRFIGRELLAAGHEVKIFCFQTAPDEPLRMESEGIEIIRTPFTPARWPHAQILRAVETTKRAIPLLLDEFQPDAIWSRSSTLAWGIRLGGYQGPLLQIFPTNAKMNCRGLYLHTHGLPLRRRLMLLGLWPSAYLASSRLERKLSRQCEIVAFSENMSQQLLADFPKDVRSCNVIPPGVDCGIFSPENGARYFDAIERKYGLRRDEPIVLYVGRLSCAKQIPKLMDAVSVLDSRVKLVLVGSGMEKACFQAYAHRLGFAERVVFAGTHHEMLPGFYAISRVFVLPTTIESFGQTYLESLASGTPAVGFAGDGRGVLTATSEIIRDGETGGVVNEVSASALAEKINSILLLDQGDYETMAARAREDVLKRFCWKRFVTEALALSSNCTLENDGQTQAHE